MFTGGARGEAQVSRKDGGNDWRQSRCIGAAKAAYLCGGIHAESKESLFDVYHSNDLEAHRMRVDAFTDARGLRQSCPRRRID
jgi:hypothetical protein